MSFQITEDLMKHILKKTQNPTELTNLINYYSDTYRARLGALRDIEETRKECENKIKKY